MALDLWALLGQLRECRFVDLTHAFDASIPHSPFFEPETRTVVYDHPPARGERGQGFLAHRYSFVGQWGTHVDPGVHFVAGRRFLDEIPVDEMILPLVVIDIRQQVAANADYCLSIDDVLRWEAQHGPIPRGAFVAKRSGWAARWPDRERMSNRDAAGVAHFPGWTLDALRHIFEQRDATACGHETLDTDGGLAISRGDGSLERYVLGQDRWQIELLANLDAVPEAGALIVATWPKPKRGSGFPARVFAIVS
ncbi:cyclase family protein [Burkholderia sp. Ac-20379]|uniref:cyclase family protein n=1 Tax=Burkholderia sp. Ac-20379 TaxID=2703900 RepID=UPI00198224A9|nr:cyclase family protein [Burkholderia sp. Ac-20379]MBN3724772.1 cyclase family protein [Burkholderia sp. Ac-20379]